MGDRQKRLLSVMLGISTFVIYNGKLVEGGRGRRDVLVAKDLENMTLPSDLCGLTDRTSSLLWLMREVDREAETEEPSDTYI